MAAEVGHQNGETGAQKKAGVHGHADAGIADTVEQDDTRSVGLPRCEEPAIEHDAVRRGDAGGLPGRRASARDGVSLVPVRPRPPWMRSASSVTKIGVATQPIVTPISAATISLRTWREIGRIWTLTLLIP